MKNIENLFYNNNFGIGPMWNENMILFQTFSIVL